MKAPSQRYTVGICGSFGSGKSTASLLFKKRGYKVVVLSKLLEEEAKKRRLPITRKILQDIGNEWRKRFGSGILVKKAFENLGKSNKILFDGVRNIGEIEEIKKKKNSIILGIIADRRIRFERLKKLKRREKLTKKLFDSLDSRDLGVGEKMTGQQVALCIAMSDFFIDSNGTLRDFSKKIIKFIKEYER